MGTKRINLKYQANQNKDTNISRGKLNSIVLTCNNHINFGIFTDKDKLSAPNSSARNTYSHFNNDNGDILQSIVYISKLKISLRIKGSFLIRKIA